MSERYEVGVVRSVRASHVMPGDDGPEGEAHAHDYRVELTVRTAELDTNGMAVNLLDVEAALDAALDKVRDADLDAIRPAEFPAVTVEVFARWVHDMVTDRIDGDVAVRIWEHEQAFGGYRGAG